MIGNTLKMEGLKFVMDETCNYNHCLYLYYSFIAK